MKLVAPWTDLQVQNLNYNQDAGVMHPYTCGNASRLAANEVPHMKRPAVLVATSQGWRCPQCDYTQDWCHDFSANSKHIPAFGRPHPKTKAAATPTKQEGNGQGI